MEENRRATDKILLQFQTDIKTIIETQKAQGVKLSEVAEVLTVWNDTKGFVKTIRIIGNVLKWFVIFGGSLVAIYQFVKMVFRI